MKVRATRLTNAAREVVDRSSWYTLGAEYVVLAVYVQLGDSIRSRVDVLLITDEGGRICGLFDLADFEITDPTPSSLWRVTYESDSAFRLEPEPWTVPDFWAVFYGDLPEVHIAGVPGPIPDVTERFDDAVHAMMEEAGSSWPDDPASWETPSKGPY